jgi:ribose/xylose/arabinose/galactoside ABC-type transport system permease subunit
MIPSWLKPKNALDAVHYVVVFGVLAYAWVPLMNATGSDLNVTLLLGLAVFYIADKVAHKVLNVD